MTQRFYFVLIVFLGGLFLSCNKSATNQYDPNYINKFHGAYEIRCTYTYYDSVQGYLDIDTTYLTAVTMVQDNVVKFPSYNGTMIYARLMPPHGDNLDYMNGDVEVYSPSDGDFMNNNDWDITPSFTRFWVSFSYHSYADHYLPYGGHMFLEAMKQ